MYNDAGIMFKKAVEGYLREPYAIKLIGQEGADWDETFTPDDAKNEFTIVVKSGANAEKEDLASKEKRDKFYDSLMSNEVIAPKISIPSLIRVRGRDAGVKDEDIDTILDVHNSTDMAVLEDAATAVQTAIDNGPMRIYRDADTAFIQYIIDFVNKHYQVIPTEELKKLTKQKAAAYEKDMEEYDRLMAMVKAHMPFVQKNEQAKQADIIAQNPQLAPKPVQPQRVTPQMLLQLGKGGNPTPLTPDPATPAVEPPIQQ